MRVALLILFVFISFLSDAQKALVREFQVENDNDAYTLNLSRDQYYSNGVALRYRILKDSTPKNEVIQKIIKSFDINHRIYTPQRLAWSDSSQMDRPYAGQMSFSYSQEYYLKNNSYFKGKVELGWMGPSLRIGQLQYEWHKTFGMQLPQGWRYQVNEAPIINLWGTYARTVYQTQSFDIVPEFNFSAGTAFGHLRQEVMFRMGNILPISNSTQFNGTLGRVKGKPKQHEIYFFISPGFEYVTYNSTIQGSDLGKTSIYTEEIVSWIYQTRAGFMMSWTKFDFALLYYRRTKETPESTFHKYVGIRMNQRF